MEVLDNRGLEPPQPMMRTLKNLESIKNGEQLAIINDHRPLRSDVMGYLHETEVLQDYSFKITITKTGD